MERQEEEGGFFHFLVTSYASSIDFQLGRQIASSSVVLANTRFTSVTGFSVFRYVVVSIIIAQVVFSTSVGIFFFIPG